MDTVRGMLWIALLLAGCAPTEKSFPEAFAGQYCSRWEECFRADYEGRFDDRAECVDDVADSVDDVFGDCDYDQDEAVDCLQELSTEDCDDVEDAYYHCLWDQTVYECDLSDYI